MEKNLSWKFRRQDPLWFNNLVKAHNRLQKESLALSSSRKLRVHERAFRKNPWHYVRGVCSSKAKSEDLACSVEEAYTYFAGCAEDDGKYSGLPEKVSDVTQPSLGE